MKSILDRIRSWQVSRYARTGEPPKFIPITREEMLDIQTTAPTYRVYEINAEDQVCGSKCFYTPFAAEMRENSVTLEQVQIAEEAIYEPAYSATIQEHRSAVDLTLCRRLVAHVCKDDTAISVTIPFDPWARFKTALRLTRWFPIRTKTIQIDGRVLYPYLKISLPTNRHHVRFAVRP